MNKITADHLSRRACVYIRQSTPDQVRHNLESQRLQYALVDRARVLGWREVDVIDEDLGISGAGARRPGFERMLRALCSGRIGAVFSVEASRLARNGRDWHTLLEFCSVVGALLIDAETAYDPRLTNDRLLLGMKGTINEMEIATFRERAQAALRQKAERGALVRRVPIGYVKGADDRIEKDPDAGRPDLRVALPLLPLVGRQEMGVEELQGIPNVLADVRGHGGLNGRSDAVLGLEESVVLGEVRFPRLDGAPAEFFFGGRQN